MVSLDYLLYHLGAYEKFIYDNAESFLEKFSRCNGPELIHIRFGSECVEFVVFDVSGAHIVDGIKIEQFKEWFYSCTK